jgi:hypothetical protein
VFEAGIEPARRKQASEAEQIRFRARPNVLNSHVETWSNDLQIEPNVRATIDTRQNRSNEAAGESSRLMVLSRTHQRTDSGGVQGCGDAVASTALDLVAVPAEDDSFRFGVSKPFHRFMPFSMSLLADIRKTMVETRSHKSRMLELT